MDMNTSKSESILCLLSFSPPPTIELDGFELLVESFLGSMSSHLLGCHPIGDAASCFLIGVDCELWWI